MRKIKMPTFNSNRKPKSPKNPSREELKEYFEQYVKSCQPDLDKMKILFNLLIRAIDHKYGVEKTFSIKSLLDFTKSMFDPHGLHKHSDLITYDRIRIILYWMVATDSCEVLTKDLDLYGLFYSNEETKKSKYIFIYKDLEKTVGPNRFQKQEERFFSKFPRISRLVGDDQIKVTDDFVYLIDNTEQKSLFELTVIPKDKNKEIIVLTYNTGTKIWLKKDSDMVLDKIIDEYQEIDAIELIKEWKK